MEHCPLTRRLKHECEVRFLADTALAERNRALDSAKEGLKRMKACRSDLPDASLPADVDRYGHLKPKSVKRQGPSSSHHVDPILNGYSLDGCQFDVVFRLGFGSPPLARSLDQIISQSRDHGGQSRHRKETWERGQIEI